MRVTKGNTPSSPQSAQRRRGIWVVGVLAAEGAQQCRTFADEKTDEGFPTFKSVITLMEGFAALGARTCVDEMHFERGACLKAPFGSMIREEGCAHAVSHQHHDRSSSIHTGFLARVDAG